MNKLKNIFFLVGILTLSLFQIKCSSSGNSKNNERNVISQKFIEPKEININFDSLEEGDYPKNFGGLTIMKLEGNKVLATPSKGSYTFEIKNPFPLDFRLNISMAGYTGNRSFVAVTLLSPKGDLSFWIRLDLAGIISSKYEFGFYDTQIIGKKNHPLDKLSNVELKKSGETYKIYLDNNFVCSIQNDDYLQFTGLRIYIESPDKFEYEPYLKGYCIGGISINPL